MLNIIIWIFASLSAGIIGSFFTTSAIPTWYVSLNKPFFNPPSWLFGPVWTILYILMGVAMGKIAKVKLKDKKLKKQAYLIFITQLIFNSLWSIIFFGLKLPLVAFLEILILLGLIIATAKIFKKILPLAAYLLYPYIAWVSFATVLNLFIVLLN